MLKSKLSYLNQKKFLYIGSLFFLVLGVMRFAWILKTTSELAPSQSHTPNEVIYLPSPVEAQLLGPRGGLWPQVFNPQFPLQPERIPHLYTEAQGRSRAVVAPDLLEQARRWSVELNSLHLENLKASLRAVMPDPEALLKKNHERRCDILEQEAFFRWTQVDERLKNRVLEYFVLCGVHTPLKDWYELQAALEMRHRSRIERVMQRLRLRSLVPDTSWNRWFAEKMTRYAQLVQSGESTPGFPSK